MMISHEGWEKIDLIRLSKHLAAMLYKTYRIKRDHLLIYTVILYHVILIIRYYAVSAKIVTKDHI